MIARQSTRTLTALRLFIPCGGDSAPVYEVQFAHGPDGG